MTSPNFEMTLTSEEMNEISVSPTPTRNVATGASKGYSTEPSLDDLKRKIELLEKDLAKYKKLRKNSIFEWFEVNEYTNMDIVSATRYISEEVATKINKLIDVHRNKFELILTWTRTSSKTRLRTCTNYNTGKRCNLKAHDTLDCHLDGPCHRIHCCQLCRECLSIFATHRVLECPLLHEDFWEQASN